jgi:hypothetical protein
MTNARLTEARGASPKERYEQFDHISERHRQFKVTGDPIINMGVQKKN